MFCSFRNVSMKFVGLVVLIEYEWFTMLLDDIGDEDEHFLDGSLTLAIDAKRHRRQKRHMVVERSQGHVLENIANEFGQVHEFLVVIIVRLSDHDGVGDVGDGDVYSISWGRSLIRCAWRLPRQIAAPERLPAARSRHRCASHFGGDYGQAYVTHSSSLQRQNRWSQDLQVQRDVKLYYFCNFKKIIQHAFGVLIWIGPA